MDYRLSFGFFLSARKRVLSLPIINLSCAFEHLPRPPPNLVFFSVGLLLFSKGPENDTEI